jgi:hypothetical protein
MTRRTQKDVRLPGTDTVMPTPNPLADLFSLRLTGHSPNYSSIAAAFACSGIIVAAYSPSHRLASDS